MGEVLKFGSFIVDQLTQFMQPIIVYIPPHCEIRGGAWVVIDSKINPRYMDMYAAEDARGGVLEPAGISEIKFRRPDLVKTMHRIDQQLQWMKMTRQRGCSARRRHQPRDRAAAQLPADIRALLRPARSARANARQGWCALDRALGWL